MSEQKYLLSDSPSLFSRAYWHEATLQLRNVRMLCVAAIFIALRVAIHSLYIPVGENLSIYFGYLVNALGSMIYGPVVALVAGAASDTLGTLLFPSGAYFFPFIFVEMLGSFLYGICLWQRKLSATRVIVSRFLVTLCCNILLNPIIMIWYYSFLNNGKSYAFVTIPRLLKNLALFPAEAFVLAVFLSAVTPLVVRVGFLPKDTAKVLLEKKHYFLLGILFILSLGIVLAYYKLYLANR